jgi:small-conductance mechanosensitive channel
MPRPQAILFSDSRRYVPPWKSRHSQRTCLMFVLAVGSLILQVLLPAGGAPPTALQCAVMYAVLSFAASCVTLALLDYDLRVVLATSAIGTAIVGFAMRPTLGSVISGMALNVDRTIHVGDGTIYSEADPAICHLRDGNQIESEKTGGSRNC